MLSVQPLLQEDSHHGSHSPKDGLFVLEMDGRGLASKTEGLPFLQSRLFPFPFPIHPCQQEMGLLSLGKQVFPTPSSPALPATVL